jgi:hypothetical protein
MSNSTSESQRRIISLAGAVDLESIDVSTASSLGQPGSALGA